MYSGFIAPSGMDVEALRKATPALPGVVHFNTAGSGLLPFEVAEVLQEHLARELRQDASAAAASVAEEIQDAREEAARLIGADTSEIAFTTGNSDGWNAAFTAMPTLRPGDRVLVGAGEWGGNVLTLIQECARTGARLERIPELADGRMDISGLADMIDPKLRLIAVSWIGAHLGHAAPVEAIGKIARAHGIPYFVDAAQAAGVLPIDVSRIGCDVLTAPGRKSLRGPKGTGFLYVREGFLEALQPRGLTLHGAHVITGKVVLRSDTGRFEADEFSPALRLGLGAALKLANRLGAEEIRHRVLERSEALRRVLSEVPDLVLRETGPAESHITTFHHPAICADKLQHALAKRDIAVKAMGARVAPFATLEAPRGSVCRASVSYLTDDEDIERLGAALSQILAEVDAS
ncbi:Selenocysteine lyase/Cysteine desulfurase [Pseudooceanicola antarcticus]|uniref:Aminotransferase class V-fold PLP-dependent enzyme n=1 Tax=Pseudooceanicola antarcticus TaxID=1247613 RepID=A0A285JIA5_9RHOB|nr:aminotransferase class V-fold PLP-dependent enzyme [Pseudooceanicola antarcticus]PJE26437.1 aminotransferase class V-fold PLP-dependent enzyme [Pseudooceanicola antarcticus]SNY59537.1 Selenocysteine lyase/Cysteine desulfurase [Pseudooceanicola antarcticus]